MAQSTRRSFLTAALQTAAATWVALSGSSMLGCNNCSPVAKYGGPPMDQPPPVVAKYGGPAEMQPGSEPSAAPAAPTASASNSAR